MTMNDLQPLAGPGTKLNFNDLVIETLVSTPLKVEARMFINKTYDSYFTSLIC